MMAQPSDADETRGIKTTLADHGGSGQQTITGCGDEGDDDDN